jgi:AcrR family transcriptional regulator
MRADALRNADAVLLAGAEVLAANPEAPMSAIAAAAGVDRTTVYRRFRNREALLHAIHAAKMDAIDDVFAEARLEEAPIEVALHRYAEGAIRVSRRWPVDRAKLEDNPDAAARGAAARARIDAFARRGQAEGAFDPTLDPTWIRTLITELTNAAAHAADPLEPGPAADVVVRSLLRGVAA